MNTRFFYRFRLLLITMLGLGLFSIVQPVSAHVKWFSQFEFTDQPLTLSQLITPTFIGLTLLSFIVIGGMVLIDKQLDNLGWYGRINKWLIDQKQYSVLVMRIAMAALLLVSWSSDAVLAPELKSTVGWLIWAQFILAALLLFRQTIPAAGLGIILLYLVSMFEFGFFHLLDYLHYLGIGFYLLVSRLKDERLRELGLPALYATVGFSLLWLGFEKLVYPGWGLYLIGQNPQLALGFPPEFFLQGAAFVEISLGYLLLIGLLERPLAAVITLVFFTTTLVFGKIEVVGHTPLHAALIVFLFNGPGYFYKPPIAIHKKLNWRILFATVNLIVAIFVFGFAYTASAAYQFETAVADSGEHNTGIFDLTEANNIPEISKIDLIRENLDSYNLLVEIDNWTFTPESTGQPTVANEGHGHVFVDGQKVGRLYSNWLHLGDLEPGRHVILVTLNGNDHRQFVVNGEVIGREEVFNVE